MSDSLNKPSFENFHYSKLTIDRPFIDRRIGLICGQAGWRTVMSHMARLGMGLPGLRSMEVGCGTATFSLILALLGAQVTVMDADEDALAAAEKSFSLYGLTAEYVKGDVTQPPPESFAGKFDFVSSGGLAEHFTGDRRTAVIAHHRMLLKDGGFAYITVPNALSPCYRTVRAALELTGQWSIETEIPFTPDELVDTAAKAGFKGPEVSGLMTPGRDVTAHLLALGSIALRCMPGKVKNFVKGRKTVAMIKDAATGASAPGTNIADFVRKKREQALSGGEQPSPYDRFCSSITLFGFTQ